MTFYYSLDNRVTLNGKILIIVRDVFTANMQSRMIMSTFVPASCLCREYISARCRLAHRELGTYANWCL